MIKTQIRERRREKCQSGWEYCNSYISSITCCLIDKYEQTWSNAWDVFALTVCRCYLESKGLITFFSVPLSIPELKQLHACYIFNQDKPLNLNQQTLLFVNYAPFCSSLSCFTILSCLIHMIWLTRKLYDFEKFFLLTSSQYFVLLLDPPITNSVLYNAISDVCIPGVLSNQALKFHVLVTFTRS